MALVDVLDTPMNHKKILRLMLKFNLYAKVRHANLYRLIEEATEAHRRIQNHLNRIFKQEEPGKVFLTDITYLQYRGRQRAYLSCVKDVATREIIAYQLSTTLKMSIPRRLKS